ncbi:hypothetical protein JZ751_026622 [Albula glossodonta]|uniref:Uncharacterized protein n=1 Tax=Albula glossodonta TaxID=121402 RepID=A0A8T2PL16_9TELE|nr:hypothetical protein JZ751_026622 [Albula glossodonta]
MARLVVTNSCAVVRRLSRTWVTATGCFVLDWAEQIMIQQTENLVKEQILGPGSSALCSVPSSHEHKRSGEGVTLSSDPWLSKYKREPAEPDPLTKTNQPINLLHY